jgi:hypothetical protein
VAFGLAHGEGRGGDGSSGQSCSQHRWTALVESRKVAKGHSFPREGCEAGLSEWAGVSQRSPACATASEGQAVSGLQATRRSLFIFGGLFFGVLRQGLAMQPRLASNSQCSCFSLPSAGITGVLHHARLQTPFVTVTPLSAASTAVSFLTNTPSPHKGAPQQERMDPPVPSRPLGAPPWTSV